MTLQNLHEFNAMMTRAYKCRHSIEPAPNGIACPACNTELMDSHPGRRLASNPPKMQVHCPACGYRGYRLS